MSTAIWAALGFLCLVIVAGTAWVGLNAFRAWRHLKPVPADLAEQIGTLSEAVVVLERRLASVEQQTAELQRSIDRLTVDVARARVLAAAAGEVQGAVRTVRSFIPTK